METTEKFIQKNVSVLTTLEVTQTAEAMQSLQLALTMDNKDLIQERIEALNEISKPYAERAMNQGIQMALKGKSIDEG